MSCIFVVNNAHNNVCKGSLYGVFTTLNTLFNSLSVNYNKWIYHDNIMFSDKVNKLSDNDIDSTGTYIVNTINIDEKYIVNDNVVYVTYTLKSQPNILFICEDYNACPTWFCNNSCKAINNKTE